MIKKEFMKSNKIGLCLLLLSFIYSKNAFSQSCKLKITFKDTISWGEARDKGIIFSADPVATASYWAWNFGDPQSLAFNIAPFAWITQHKFTGGPGIYKVTFTLNTPTCGTIDTCFNIYITGPMARIVLPEEQYRNNYLPATPMPLSEFTKANNANACTNPVNYSIFTNKVSKTYKVYTYCNAKAINGSAEYDTVEICSGKEYRLRKIKYQPTDSFTVTKTDSTETIKTYLKGSPVPSNAYYPSSGKANVLRTEPDGLLRYDKPINMHDSDIYTCNSENYVKFTNHSIKYRLWNATDDKFPYLNPDTCKHKNYPYASDSMTYLWKFNDPNASPCTSTVSNPNPDCNYSTEVAPYHHFKKNSSTGCQAVMLVVTDKWTDKNGILRTAKDSTTMQLHSGAPDAGWDKSVFPTMNFEKQEEYMNWGYRVGFRMRRNSEKCAGISHAYSLQFQNTLPSCGPENYWLVFDSAAAVRPICTVNGKMKYDYGFLGATNKQGYPIAGPKSLWEGWPWRGTYWYNLGDTGYKTIGVVLKNGNCYDTAWYHNYFRLSSAFVVFCLYDSKNNNLLACSNEINKSLCPDSLGHKPSFINIIPKEHKVKDYAGGIRYYINRLETPANDYYYSKPFWPDGASLESPEVNITDSVTRENYALGRDTIKMKMPYPGAYQITASSTNGDCMGISQLIVINGHYAKFWANDSVICVGDTVRFDQKTRYWTTNCGPATPYGIPSTACINENLSAWDNDPVAIRKTLGWDPTKNTGFTKELKPEWNYGDGTTSNNSTPGNADKSRPYHVYTKPGVYSVTMITQDSNNCKIATVRKNFIKVVEVKPGFTVSNSKDTQSYCGTFPVLKDTSKLILSPYSKGKYARYIELVKKRDPFSGAYSLSMDTITVDSLIYSDWQIGNASFTTAYGENEFPPFTETGTLDVKLTSKSAHCEAEIEKKGVITIPALKQIFQPADSIGCTPFSVKIKLNKSYAPAYNYRWNKGDGTFQNSYYGDTAVTLTYNTPGRYSLSVTVTDTVFNNNSYDTCRITYPDTVTNPLLPRYHITVMDSIGKPEIKIFGKDSLYSSITATKYFWIKDGVLLSGNTKGIKVSQKGDYQLYVTSGNCISDTSDVYRFDPNSIQYRNAEDSGVYVYPNPTTNIITIENNNSEITSFELVNVTGKKVISYNQKLPVGKYPLQLGSYAKGIYYLNMHTKTQILHIRIVLQ
jgi:PKD repeat protein